MTVQSCRTMSQSHQRCWGGGAESEFLRILARIWCYHCLVFSCSDRCVVTAPAHYRYTGQLLKCCPYICAFIHINREYDFLASPPPHGNQFSPLRVNARPWRTCGFSKPFSSGKAPGVWRGSSHQAGSKRPGKELVWASPVQANVGAGPWSWTRGGLSPLTPR